MNKGDQVQAVVQIPEDGYCDFSPPIPAGTKGVVTYVGVICDTVVVDFEGYGVCYINKNEVSVCHGTSGC